MKELINNITYNFRVLLLMFTLVALLTSCHKEISTVNQVSNTITVNYKQVFEDYWSSMNKTYVFWSIDTTNWDNVHTKYGNLFTKLDSMGVANPNLNIDSIAWIYYNDLSSGLIDSHYALYLDYPQIVASNPFNPSPSFISPAYNRKFNNPQFIQNVFTTNQLYPDYPNTYNYYTLAVDTQPKYLSLTNRFVGVDSGASSIAPNTQYFAPNEFYAISGYITNTNILYFSFNRFSLLSILSDTDSASFQAQAAILNFLNQLNNPNLSGVIIDVRGNGGGETSDLNFLVGRLISNKIKVGQTRSKNGSGRLEYTPWADAIVSPWASGTSQYYGLPPVTNFTKPIVVLADGLSASMSELTTMSLKTLSNTTFVGDTTWGANGPLTQNSDFNTGSFNFGNTGANIENYGQNQYYGFAYTSSCMFKYINGKIYEGKGFPPDVEIKADPNVIYSGSKVLTDPQLDKAISLLPH